MQYNAESMMPLHIPRKICFYSGQVYEYRVNTQVFIIVHLQHKTSSFKIHFVTIKCVNDKNVISVRSVQ